MVLELTVGDTADRTNNAVYVKLSTYLNEEHFVDCLYRRNHSQDDVQILDVGWLGD